MKCWIHNKSNPINKGNSIVYFDDYWNYGDLPCVIGMISALSAVKQSNRKKAKRQGQDANNKSLKEREENA